MEESSSASSSANSSSSSSPEPILRSDDDKFLKANFESLAADEVDNFFSQPTLDAMFDPHSRRASISARFLQTYIQQKFTTEKPLLANSIPSSLDLEKEKSSSPSTKRLLVSQGGPVVEGVVDLQHPSAHAQLLSSPHSISETISGVVAQKENVKCEEEDGAVSQEDAVKPCSRPRPHGAPVSVTPCACEVSLHLCLWYFVSN